jgi:uncharacterized membrane protein YidH (DUF202 family)
MKGLITMSEHPAHRPWGLTRVRGTVSYACTLAVLVVLGVLGMMAALRQRWEAVKNSGDAGDVTQTAVLVAIGLLLAVGLAAAITAVVNKCQSQIK